MSQPNVIEPDLTDETRKSSVVVQETEFKFKLNGVRDLETRLEEFKEACESHEKQQRRRCKRRYYSMGVMAKVVSETSDEELCRLLCNGTRTFHFDAVMNKPSELEDIVTRTKAAIADFQANEPHVQIVTGLALEITGDCCRMGRLRNNCSVLLSRGAVITLTINEAYRYSGYKEIAYVINLRHYLKVLQLNDELALGKEVRGKIAKVLHDSVALRIEEPGILNSYEFIELPEQCYALQHDALADLFRDDLLIAHQIGANYVVVPNIRCKLFLKTLQVQVLTDGAERGYTMKLIGTIDYTYVISKMLDLMGLVRLLDYVWVIDAFSTFNTSVLKYIYEDVIPIAKCLHRPIIGTVPLERCSDFRRFENHNFLWKIDAMCIEKSAWCGKYPLIVRKLLPIRDFRVGVVEHCLVVKQVLDAYHTIVNFIIRTISSIECQAIFVHSRCERAAVALGRVEIYCPVYVVIQLCDEDEYAVENQCYIELARDINLRRNLHAIVFNKEQNECNLKPIEFGMECVRQVGGLLETGDFVITLEVCKEKEENVEYGTGEDVVILRAFYLPPSQVCEKYKYS